MRASTLARKGVKVAVLPLGVMRPRRPGDFVVLLYHRVGVGEREIDLRTPSFEHQLRVLAERERVVSLDRALADEGGGVVLTFDDGYRDFHEQVLPLLVRYRMPALLYLATGFVADGRSGGEADSLTWSMLREAVASGLVTVGAHTHNHANLSSASQEEAEVEMRRSKELVEDHLGEPCRHFAYPWGVASPGADRAARALFDSAALGNWETNRRDRLDPYRLGRTPILRSDGGLMFRAKTRGLLEGEALAYRVLRRGPWRDGDELGVVG